MLTAEAEAKQRTLAGKGEASRVMQTGLAEAGVLLRKIGSFGDPRLYALALVAEHLSKSQQPLVPQQMFVAGGGGGGTDNGSEGGGGSGMAGAQGLLGTLISLLVAEKSGFHPTRRTVRYDRAVVVKRERSAPKGSDFAASAQGLAIPDIQNDVARCRCDPDRIVVQVQSPRSLQRERAAALLRATDRSVAAICFAVGLRSVGSFTTSFARAYRITPTAYRASHLNPLHARRDK